ncbi:MAG TPA: hypothetical protein VHZ76_02850 [Gammaproteobacteria bacterium]|jgi:membrane associated rhomboid family serine protease|nr:hypothetical protein [Gammaproteobacteria bacterium]
MNNIINQFTSTIALLQENLFLVLWLIGGLYAIHFINWMIGYRLNFLGIRPRKFFGLVGIFFSPFLHSNFNHLFFNSIPLGILASFVLLHGIKTFIYVSAIIIVLGGFGTTQVKSSWEAHLCGFLAGLAAAYIYV